MIADEEIDLILRTGSGHKGTLPRIVSKLVLNVDAGRFSEFLKREYKEGGKGFDLSGRKISVWYDREGISFSQGTSARYACDRAITWEEAADRIKALYESGEYADNQIVTYCLEEVRQELASTLSMLHRDGMGAFPEWPDGYEKGAESIAEGLRSDDKASEAIRSLKRLVGIWEENGKGNTWRASRCREAIADLEDLCRIPHYVLQKDMRDRTAPQVAFITQDELEEAILRNGLAGKLLQFFSMPHAKNEESAFLKHEYGIGGSSHSIPGSDDSWEEHSAKGMTITKGSLLSPYAKCVLKWEDVAVIVRRSIQEGRALPAEVLEEYDVARVQDDGEEQPLSEKTTKGEVQTEQPEEQFPTSALGAEPVVTVLWSEHGRFHDGETMSLFEANEVFGEIDKEAVPELGYYKTKFRIDFVMNGEPDCYEGRQDFGDGDGTLIEHIEGYHAYYEKDQQWEEFVLKNEGAEALEADKEHRNMLLHEFVPYLKMHNNLSLMEQIATKELQENRNLTPAKTAYYTAVNDYVSKCRRMLNNGNYSPPSVPQLQDFDTEIAAYKEHLEEELAQEAATVGVAVEEYAANGYEPYAAPEPDNAGPATAGSFHLQEIEEAGPKERFRRNMEAIRILKRCEAEGRLAAPEEQDALSKYVGWGGLASAFDAAKEPWASEYRALLEELTDEEYRSARESVLNAYYTPLVVIKAIYEALYNLGFRTGKILEPSLGVGHFFGAMPQSMRGSQLYGAELDSISGRIARQLYPDAQIQIKGYEETDYPDGSFDIAVGNVPFGDYSIDDPKYNRYKFRIHDYFLAKTIDQLRPGGVAALITSKGTLDKANTGVREYLAERARLLGAIRLPNDAFKGNAGTSVTADILFLQKREEPPEGMPQWLDLSKDASGVAMNAYFAAHPEMVLGEMKEASGPYGTETTCVPDKSRPFDEQLRDAIQHIQGEFLPAIASRAEEQETSLIEEDEAEDLDIKEYSYAMKGGKIYYHDGDHVDLKELPQATAKRIEGLIGIRDSCRRLIRLQLDERSSEEEMDKERAVLNARYDAFYDQYGTINSRTNRQAFSADSSYYLLCSLENLDEKGGLESKADMFYRRTIKMKTDITKAENAVEALSISKNERAGVDLGYMSRLTGKAEKELTEDLKGVIFQDPLTEQWETSDEYLSGNVREKLETARRYAKEDERYEPNVRALEQIQPKDLDASEIDVRLGATWISPGIYEQFMAELLHTPRYLLAYGGIGIEYSALTGAWSIKGKGKDLGDNHLAYGKYGTNRANAYCILEDCLNLREVQVFDTVRINGQDKRILNKKETMLAVQKQEAIKEAFQEWIFKDQKRRESLCKIYNERYNSTRPREYDGSHLTFPGMNPEYDLRPYQRNAVAHQLYGGNTLLAHSVGAGKTFTMAAAAMESKRLGLSHKALFVVPNHLIEQWGSEFLKLYPSASVLVTKKKDFEAGNRKKFCTRIALGDYDAVIMGHSQFEKIPLSEEWQKESINEQIREITDYLSSMQDRQRSSFTVKQLVRTQKQLEARLKKLTDDSRKDDVITFEELGIDRLYVDEAHYYKNLFLYTKMRNVAGIGSSEAQKATDLFNKCRYLGKITGGKGITFATGTPISNSMAELYTMQRYLQPGRLKELGLDQFDSWASVFGETVTAVELAPEGKGYRAKTRFAKFHNIPELMLIYREIADIQTAQMLDLPVPKADYETIVLKPTQEQEEIMGNLVKRAEAVRKGGVDSSRDNMLLITNDGRRLALDQRLVNALYPDSPDNKASACVERAVAIWEDTMDEKCTQLIFCDLSTPKKEGFNVYDDVKHKLMERGVPESEIAFIHDAKSDISKAKLFQKVRKGQVRFLLGSTSKMGAGTNVQDRLIAIHHLDVPWKPADIEQREGRGIRQGNQNETVKIFRYVIEQTFDSYIWQLLENKLKFIRQIENAQSPARSCADLDEAVLSFAEIKALATGNPDIVEKMQLDMEVSKLKLYRANYMSNQYHLEDSIAKAYPQRIAHLSELIRLYEQDASHYKKNRIDKEDFRMEVGTTIYKDKRQAGEALLDMVKDMLGRKEKEALIGAYQGFRMKAEADRQQGKVYMHLENKMHVTAELGESPLGNIMRLDNALEGIADLLEEAREKLKITEEQLMSAKEEVGKPFPKEGELKEKQERLAELNAKLNMDKRDSLEEDKEPEQSAVLAQRDIEGLSPQI